MARKRIGMKKIMEVIRLKMSTDLSERQIGRALNISRPVVAKYWRGYQDSGLKPEQVDTMADSELLQRLQPQPRLEKSAKYRELTQYFPDFVKELKRKEVTLHLLWKEYRQKHPEGYQYSQFCYHFQVWRNDSELSMHIEHKAGDKMFVDTRGLTRLPTRRIQRFAASASQSCFLCPSCGVMNSGYR